MKKKKLNLRDIKPISEKEHSHGDGHNHSSSESVSSFKTYISAIFSFVLLITGIALDYFDVSFLKDGYVLFGMWSHIFPLDFLY